MSKATVTFTVSTRVIEATYEYLSAQVDGYRAWLNDVDNADKVTNRKAAEKKLERLGKFLDALQPFYDAIDEDGD